MSQSEFETINSILDIWRTVIQAIVFLVLWAAAFREKKIKRDGIAAVLFILAKAWAGERQMAKASSAYESNVMTETVAGGDSLLG